MKPVLLVVSFGTSYKETREKNIERIENLIQDNFPDYEVRRAFTSRMIINKLKKRDNLVIDDVKEAMEKIVSDGVKDVIIQPTHIIAGFEYNEILDEAEKYRDKLENLKIGKPLFYDEKDYLTFVDEMTKATNEYRIDSTAIIWMGHGSSHKANATYHKLQDAFLTRGHSYDYVATVEGTPTVDELVESISKSAEKISNLVLLPLMLVAGDHATGDMAGDDEDSWKIIFEKKGYSVTPVLKGLGEFDCIGKMYVNSVKDVINS